MRAHSFPRPDPAADTEMALEHAHFPAPRDLSEFFDDVPIPAPSQIFTLPLPQSLEQRIAAAAEAKVVSIMRAERIESLARAEKAFEQGHELGFAQGGNCERLRTRFAPLYWSAIGGFGGLVVMWIFVGAPLTLVGFQ